MRSVRHRCNTNAEADRSVVQDRYLIPGRVTKRWKESLNSLANQPDDHHIPAVLRKRSKTAGIVQTVLLHLACRRIRIAMIGQHHAEGLVSDSSLRIAPDYPRVIVLHRELVVIEFEVATH